MKKIFILYVLVFAVHYSLPAQDVFISAGQIEFEKRVNVHKNLDDMRESDDAGGGFDWYAQMKKQLPEFNVTYFNLYFDGDKTLYKPGREVQAAQKIPDWFKGPATDNIVYCDLNAGKSIARKSVYEATFLIQDSLRKATWKMTNDTREIAGFKCRKATTIIMDSVFVVAFYTDQIITPGGPESFNELPGMILGLAIPRLHATWYATKVELTPPVAAQLVPPAKGKKASNNEVVDKLKSTMKNWGKEGQHAQWQVFL
ncbi:GLPGLI family protein [Parafilimonas sp.]|uniref:GLPGLI family protein n=1 Tax=Parafilimonas sp. TaxID=1969739 RepID=UPI0039E26A77